MTRQNNQGIFVYLEDLFSTHISSITRLSFVAKENINDGFLSLPYFHEDSSYLRRPSSFTNAETSSTSPGHMFIII
jgi:hypothetical protein